MAVKYLPEWRLSLEVLPDVDGSNLAAAVEVLPEGRFVGTVVNILDKDASLVTVVPGFSLALAGFVHGIWQLTFLSVFGSFLIYINQFDVLTNIVLKCL